MATVIDAHGQAVSEVATPEAFAGDFGDRANVMFRAVFRELSNPRAGTGSTLRRDDVSGGGRKPWRQKGTGRARQGSTRSPQWRHGGVVFGPHPRSFAVDLNKKERRLALQAALAERFAANSVTVLETAGFDLTKTRDLATLLFGRAKPLKDAARILVVYAASEADGVGATLERIGANIRKAGITHSDALDVKDVLGYPRLVLTPAALAAISARFPANQEPAAGGLLTPEVL
jgi:large subunit ribosomal protein L4